MRQGLFSLVAGKQKSGVATEPRVLLYESEAKRIASYARSSPELEIGGDLLGFYEPGGSPLVFVASGPGPAAQRDATHFQQDPQFQTAVFNRLATKFRMFYVGDWHSHHGLGLSHPSGNDDAKLQDLSDKNGWPQLFSLIIETAPTSRRKEELGGPIEGFGVWWNAFHYPYRGPVRGRKRVDIEFRIEANPYETASEEIDSSIRQRDYKSRGLASAVLPRIETLDRTGVGVGSDEFVLNIYQGICSLLSHELDRSEMEVEFESGSGPRLVTFLGREKVVCTIVPNSDSTLEAVVEAVGEKEDRFQVPWENGRIGSADMRRIVASVVSHFTPTGRRRDSRNSST